MYKSYINAFFLLNRQHEIPTTDSGLILNCVSEQPAPESMFFLVYLEENDLLYIIGVVGGDELSL